MHLFLGMVAFLTGLFYAVSPLTATGETMLHTLEAFDPLLYAFDARPTHTLNAQGLEIKPATVLFLPSTHPRHEIQSRFVDTSAFHKLTEETRTLDEACREFRTHISNEHPLRLTIHVKKGNHPLCLHAQHIQHLSITVDEKIYPLTLGDVPDVTHVTLNLHLAGVTHLPEGLATLPKLRTLSFTVHDPFLLSVPQALADRKPVMSCHPILEYIHIDGQQGWAGLYDESKHAFPTPTSDDASESFPGGLPGGLPDDVFGGDSLTSGLPNHSPKKGPLYNRFPIVACNEATALVLEKSWKMPMTPCRLHFLPTEKKGAPDAPPVPTFFEVTKTFADPVITAIRIFNKTPPKAWQWQKEIDFPAFVPPFGDMQSVLTQRCRECKNLTSQAPLYWENAIEVTSQGTTHKMIGRLEVEPVFSHTASDEATIDKASGFALTLVWSQAEPDKPAMTLSLGPLYIKNDLVREGHPPYYTEALAQENYTSQGKDFINVHQMYEGTSYVRAFLTHIMNTLMAQTLRHQHIHARKDASKDTARTEKTSQDKMPAHPAVDPSLLKEGSC
ncbi:hypothetical protein [Candidatus Hepatobacter penaei]|uniref:hypothetical protein n=1 Tax=Candidatus Hepatobacter penaei TaxID=1274402 RepID=UPI0004F316DD|nr:hypothetical protein [Candidatus Hepatobacter penaei]